MATFGALAGSGIAALAYKLSGQNYVMTFALSAVPATIALVLVVFAFGGMNETGSATPKAAKANAGASAADAAGEEVQLSLFGKAKALMGAFQPAYWQALIVVSVLYFARFDASFVTLRAKMVSLLVAAASWWCCRSACPR
jgi:hypothetical protein